MTAEEKQMPSESSPETPNTDTSTALSSTSPDVQTATSPELTVPPTPVVPRRTTQSGREMRLPECFTDL